MRIQILFSLQNQLVLPLSYHHMIQGFLYQCLSEQLDFSTFLHEIGYGEERTYKLFCFSLLKGKYQIKEKSIVFKETMLLEVASISDELITILCQNLINNKELKLNHQPIKVTSFTVCNNWIDSESVYIKMLSPISVHRTIEENGQKRTVYYSPWDWEFEMLIGENCMRKYKSYSGKEISDDDITIVPIRVSEQDKYVTKFKDRTMITAWKGIYQLIASKEVLNFLYQTGIGDRNSQGFGMFEVCKEVNNGKRGQYESRME